MTTCVNSRRAFDPPPADVRYRASQRIENIMAQQGLIVFDDDAGRFGPLTDRRAAFDVRSGAWTTLERIERIVGQKADALFVPNRLAALTQQRHPDSAVNRLPDGYTSWRCVSGRAATPDAIRDTPCLTHPQGAPLAREDFDAGDAPQLARPWDLFAHLDANLRFDLDAMDLPACDRGTVTGDHRVKAAPDAKLHPMVVLNAELGPIVIDRGAIVGSFTVLAGPCYIGPHSIVASHAHIRAHTSVGPRCVVGGEVARSILHGNSSKSHAGYLGHSLVGEWVNLGAGTTVSNLKNTYGHVRVQLDESVPAQDSGQLKLGPIIGDGVRTAIGTRMLTGSCIATATMLAVGGFAPKWTRPFSFITDGSVQRYDIDRFIDTLRCFMEHRGDTLSDADEAGWRALASRAWAS
jgi:carbonic anhydrase/acetyltransferase-like protein (isoleucine patch superfamily)